MDITIINDVNLRTQILEDQFVAINLDPKKYCESFVELLK